MYIIDIVQQACRVLAHDMVAENRGKKEKHTLVLIPYYAWAHRGKSRMAVWLFR